MAGGMDEPDGVIGCHGVEIGRGDVAMFGELALVPAGAGDPFAGFDQSDLGLYTGNDFSQSSSTPPSAMWACVSIRPGVAV